MCISQGTPPFRVHVYEYLYLRAVNDLFNCRGSDSIKQSP